jgi:NtrC-family two-component system response regulator AlgB
VRLVAATNRDLEADVQAGRFRLDLLYRLNVIEVTVPALHDRREDLLPLARHFIEFVARSMRRPMPQLSPAAEALLLSYAWPGNVRELRNEIERALVLSQGDVLEPQSFSDRVRGGTIAVPTLGGNFTLEQIEQEHLLQVVARAPTRDAAARILGIDPSTLWRRLKRYEDASES